MWTSVPIPAPIWNLSSVICIMHHKSRAREAKTGGSWGLTGQTVEPKWWVQVHWKTQSQESKVNSLIPGPSLWPSRVHTGASAPAHTQVQHIYACTWVHTYTQRKKIITLYNTKPWIWATIMFFIKIKSQIKHRWMVLWFKALFT